jgi:hypothetical protein
MRKNADRNISRANENFFDCRNAIFDYYFKQNKINSNEYKSFKIDTRFIFNSYLIHKNRVNANYLKMIKYLFENFSINFKKTLIENLHINRLIKQ